MLGARSPSLLDTSHLIYIAPPAMGLAVCRLYLARSWPSPRGDGEGARAYLAGPLATHASWRSAILLPFPHSPNLPTLLLGAIASASMTLHAGATFQKGVGKGNSPA